MNRTIKLRTLAAAAVAIAATAPAAGAQEASGENALRRGASSVMAGVTPDAGVGFWTMVSDRTAVGLVGSVQSLESSSDARESRTRFLTLAPEVKRYGSTVGPILPYVHGSVFASVVDFGGGGQTRQETRAYGARAALGLDWFPVPRIGIGGHAGVGLSRTGSEHRNPMGGEYESSSWEFGTFTTAIRVHLFL